MSYGYTFYFADGSDVLEFPITPEKLTISSGSKNETITLISDGDINLLKSPSLVEVEFEARFPMRQYPFAREFKPFLTYWNKFQELKEQKKPFQFIVSRLIAVGNGIYKGQDTWHTNLRVALEDISTKESADEGDDVIVTFSLKQYKAYGYKTLPNNSSGVSNSGSTAISTSTEPREGSKASSNPTTGGTYTIKSGDCMWNIAKAHYGDGSKWTKIYEANKTVIEETANKNRKGKGSDNGHWIYPNTVLTIPKL